MSKELDLIGLTTSAHNVAIALLVKCLTKNGALKPGQYEASLRATFNDPAANWERADYMVLQRLVNLLEDPTAYGTGKGRE